MTIGALLVGGGRAPFRSQSFVAAFTGFMIGNTELFKAPRAIVRIVALGTFRNGEPLLPDVFTVLIVMVAFFAGISIPFGMVEMRKPHRSFADGFINMIVDDDFVWYRLCFIGIGAGGRCLEKRLRDLSEQPKPQCIQPKPLVLN